MDWCLFVASDTGKANMTGLQAPGWPVIAFILLAGTA